MVYFGNLVGIPRKTLKTTRSTPTFYKKIEKERIKIATRKNYEPFIIFLSTRTRTGHPHSLLNWYDSQDPYRTDTGTNFVY